MQDSLFKLFFVCFNLYLFINKRCEACNHKKYASFGIYRLEYDEQKAILTPMMMKPVAILFLLIFGISELRSAPAAVLIGLTSGNELEYQRISRLFDQTESILHSSGFPGERIFRLDENRPFGKQELAELGKQLCENPPAPSEACFIFVAGHLQITRRGEIRLKTPKGFVKSEDFCSFFSEIPGKTLAFCFTLYSWELANELASRGMTSVAFTSEPGMSSPPAIPDFFIARWNSGEASSPHELYDTLKQAAVDAQADAARRKVFFNELPAVFIPGEPGKTYPFPHAEPIPLTAELRPEKADSEVRTPEPVPEGAGYACFEKRVCELILADGSEALWKEHGEIRILSDFGARLFTLFQPSRGGAGKIFSAVHRMPSGQEISVQIRPETGQILIPDLCPGSRILYDFEAPAASFLSGNGRFGFSVPLSGLIPQKSLSLRLRMPESMQLLVRFHGEGEISASAAEKRGPYSLERRWEIRDIPAIPDLPDIPPEIRSGTVMLISSLKNWEEFAEYYRGLTEGCEVAGEGVSRQVKRLTEHTPDGAGKLRKIYDFVNQLRYDSTVLGIRALRPRLAETVLATGVGDCKDKANLLAIMARLSGFPSASPAILNRGAFCDPDFPAWQFNHMLVRIPPCAEFPEGLWLDPTDSETPFGSLPPGDAGQNALVFYPASVRFEKVANVPGKLPRLSQIWRAGTPDPEGKNGGKEKKAGREDKLHLTLLASGLQAYPLRHQIKRLSEEGRTYFLQTLLNRLLPGAELCVVGTAGTEEETGKNYVDTEEGVRLSLLLRRGKRSLFRIDPALTDSFALPGRRLPIWWNDGHGLIYELEFPCARNVPDLRKSFDSPDLRASVEVTGGRVLCRVELSPGAIPAEHYPVCRTALRAADDLLFQIQTEGWTD